MSNSTTCTRHFKKLELSDSSAMPASGNSEYVTAPATETEHAPSSSSTFFSGRTSVEEQIEQSKSHWSHLVDDSDSDNEELAEIENVIVFKTLQSHPTWGDFFLSFGEGTGRLLEVGDKFAEGGQAELFHAQVDWSSYWMNEWDRQDGNEWVLKVFKKGTLLRRLQTQWPHGMLQFHAEEVKRTEERTRPWIRYLSGLMCGILLEDGRFAFLIKKEQEDLRTYIDRHMKLKTSQDHGPFSEDVTKSIMYNVAMGMEWLHNRNIIHRDLKASNVLVYKHDKHFRAFVADYECSIGVVGTGFFRAPEILLACKDRNISHRAPEILLACKDRNISQRLGLFTKEAHVYSYGMMCYEVLTGRLPFEDHSLNNYDLVLNGQRPILPEYVDDWACGLLSRCWHPNPKARPSFGDILNVLVTNSIGVLVNFRKIECPLDKEEEDLGGRFGLFQA